MSFREARDHASVLPASMNLSRTLPHAGLQAGSHTPTFSVSREIIPYVPLYPGSRTGTQHPSDTPGNRYPTAGGPCPSRPPLLRSLLAPGLSPPAGKVTAPERTIPQRQATKNAGDLPAARKTAYIFYD